MKLRVLLIIGFALSMTGCENKEQAAPEQAAEAESMATSMPPNYRRYHCRAREAVRALGSGYPPCPIAG